MMRMRAGGPDRGGLPAEAPPAVEAVRMAVSGAEHTVLERQIKSGDFCRIFLIGLSFLIELFFLTQLVFLME